MQTGSGPYGAKTWSAVRQHVTPAGSLGLGDGRWLLRPWAAASQGELAENGAIRNRLRYSTPALGGRMLWRIACMMTDEERRCWYPSFWQRWIGPAHWRIRWDTWLFQCTSKVKQTPRWRASLCCGTATPSTRRRAGREQGHLFLRLRRPSFRSLVRTQPCAFFLRHLQLSRRPGNLFYLFSNTSQKPAKKAPVVYVPWSSNMLAAWCLACSTRQPASPACRLQLIYANHWDGDFYCRFEVRTNATVVVSLLKRNLFLLFWERRRNHQRALRDLTGSFLVTTIDEAHQWLAVTTAVRCLLLTTNAANIKHHALAKSL